METLRLGSKGPLVEQWQTYLRGQDLYIEEVTGEFDEETKEATRRFQTLHGLYADGIAGNQTLGRAMVDGFEVVKSDDEDREGPNWPPVPEGLTPASLAIRHQLFGKFDYVAAPTAGNPEAITIKGKWTSENITKVTVPQLKGVQGAGSGVVYFHKKAADQLLGLFAAWEEAGLMPLVKTWAGSWVPRFVRGSRTSLSNHAWGTAFDVCAAWNGLGRRPALVGETGSVRELVPLANEWGFWWGGHGFGSGTRLDGMHFECARLLSEEG